MKFLIDESLPPMLCKWLIAKGHEADHVMRVRLDSRPDHDVRAYAHQNGAVIVTKDKDYIDGTQMFQTVQIVWVKFGNTGNRDLIRELEPLWDGIEAELLGGEPIVSVSRADPTP